MAVCKLGLGTVQFGLPYGITNRAGQVSFAEAGRILDKAREVGIRVLDSAAVYGNGEEVLGQLLRLGDKFSLVTKTVPIEATRIGKAEMARIEACFDASLSRLCRPGVDALLVHHAEDLLVPGGERIYAQLEQWRAAGKVARIGVSVYDQNQIERLFERYSFEVVQLPSNVFDQRLVASGTLSELARRGVAIHVRSVFLQGLLLQLPGQWPGRFAAWQPLTRRYHEHLDRLGVSPLAAAINFASRQPGVEAVLIGVENRRQLEDCLAAETRPQILNLQEFACEDLDLIDPRRWT
jgi:aryl-alcohol dehydrogenase-like predicted oxidoreductase